MGLSRNKVAVSEGAAGSPPFYGERITDREMPLCKFTMTETFPMECCSIFKDQGFLRVSVINAEGPPVPIPNTEVKLCSGENTLRATVRENNSMLTLSKGRMKYSFLDLAKR